MAREQFIEKRFNESSVVLINQAEIIITEYQADGYVLTLRQLYYQFVSRGWLPNTLKNYKRLGSVISDARLAGLLDWDAIEDRVRSLETISHWSSCTSILEATAEQFKYDPWDNQEHRMEVWVEKDALAGVIERACAKRRVPFFACRGYTSQSSQYTASKRFVRYLSDDQHVTIIHLGDHDPSGIDMTRDNTDRLETFLKPYGGDITFKRIALNTNQVRQYNPPPNPVKLTDSRSPQYKKDFGDESWELDALDPKVIVRLVDREIEKLVDEELWEDALEREGRAKKKLFGLVKASKKWKGL